MESAQDTRLVMPQSTGDKVRTGVMILGIWALLFAVMNMLGFNPIASVVLIALCTIRLSLHAFVLFTSPPPALTTEGIRLRTRGSDPVVPWSEILSVGLVRVSRMSRMYLEIVTTNSKKYPGPRKDGVNFIYLSPTVVTPEQVRDAVDQLTEGRLVVQDEPYRRTLSG
jgi:hypothetical protein